MLAFFILSFLLFSAGSIALNPKYSFPLYDVDSFSAQNFSISEILEKRLARDKVRVNYLLNAISGSAVVFPVPGAYLTIINAGWSKQKIPLMIDTGSSITWWQCDCNTSCYPQIDPIYNSSEPQSTFQLIPCYQNLRCLQYPGISCGEFGECQYRVNYMDGDSSGGPMAQELVYIGDQIKTEIIFGCGRFQSGTHFSPYAAGIMGLSLGPYSLVRQLNVSVFSLCLPPIMGEEISTLEFNVEHLAAKEDTTSFIPPPTSLKDPIAGEFHYVAIKEVWVTDVRIDVPPSYWGFEFGGEGSLIDLGTTLTHMPTYAYKSLRDNFTAQVQNHVPELTLLEDGFQGLETCFRVKDPETIIWEHLPLPFIQINFMDNSSYYALEVEQMFLRVSDDSDDILCLAFQDSGEGEGTILGNTLFQRTRLTYDLSAQTISFDSYSCY